MFDWITHNKGLFLNSYTEIGTSHPHAMDLQTQHNHFAMNCMVRRGWKQERVPGILGLCGAGGERASCQDSDA